MCPCNQRDCFPDESMTEETGAANERGSLIDRNLQVTTNLSVSDGGGQEREKSRDRERHQ
ncbi:hypothetical protein BJX96DRAFT_151250 [Aspergillus floccosus]